MQTCLFVQSVRYFAYNEPRNSTQNKTPQSHLLASFENDLQTRTISCAAERNVRLLPIFILLGAASAAWVAPPTRPRLKTATGASPPDLYTFRGQKCAFSSGH
jgi:hypothetical protein